MSGIVGQSCCRGLKAMPHHIGDLSFAPRLCSPDDSHQRLRSGCGHLPSNGFARSQPGTSSIRKVFLIGMFFICMTQISIGNLTDSTLGTDLRFMFEKMQ